MTTGALIFAQNNAKIDYTKLAIFCATRVKQYLNIPVSIVTDNVDWVLKTCPADIFDQIIGIEYDTKTQQKRFYDSSMSSNILNWNNLTRFRAYELSPYENTLVLDSDYIISSSILTNAFDQGYDFQIFRKRFELSGWRSDKEFDRLNQCSIPFYWATVFFFKKCQIMESFFDLISYIRSNWVYFRVLYNIESPLFRNDYAFSIAIHIMNGKTNGEFAVELPGKMIYTLDRDILIDIDENKMKFLVEKKDYLGEYIAVKTEGLDVHVMNKSSLTRFIDGGIGV